MTVEFDAPFVGANEAGDHVENRGLAGAVGAKQTHSLPLPHVEADTFDHLAADEGFSHAVDREHALALERRRYRQAEMHAAAAVLALVRPAD